LLFAAIALPWFVLAQLKYPDFFDYIIIKQHFARYTASTFNSVSPWWFYLMALGILFFPWAVFSLVPWLPKMTERRGVWSGCQDRSLKNLFCHIFCGKTRFS
jgi:4-amino-4-deoxy-L-arabinose transferase-like glycosyltransferase